MMIDRKKRDLAFLVVVLAMLVASCGIKSKTLTLGDAAPMLQTYEGSSYDPKIDKSVIVSGMNDYDEFFLKVRQISMIVGFERNVLDAYNRRRAANQSISTLKQPLKAGAQALVVAGVRIHGLVKTAPALAARAKQDFTGINAAKGLKVTKAVMDALGELQQIISQLPGLVGELQTALPELKDDLAKLLKGGS